MKHWHSYIAFGFHRMTKIEFLREKKSKLQKAILKKVTEHNHTKSGFKQTTVILKILGKHWQEILKKLPRCPHPSPQGLESDLYHPFVKSLFTYPMSMIFISRPVTMIFSFHTSLIFSIFLLTERG